MSNETREARKPFYVMGGVALAIVLGLWFGRNLTAPAAESNAQLEAVKAAVLSFAKAQGAAPPDIEALVTGGYLDSVPRNRSGFPLVYRKLENGRVEIADLGPDGEEGGFMFKKDYRIVFAVQ